MARGKNLTSKITEYASVGVGVLAADKVGDFIPVENQLVKDAAPAVLGYFLSGQKGMIGNVGTGMIAGSLANIIGGFIPPIGGFNFGSAGPIGNVNTMDNQYKPGYHGSESQV